MVKKRYTSEENNLLATLRKIKYNSRPTPNTISKYYEENKELIDSIEKVNIYPSQRAILLTHFKKEFVTGNKVKEYKLPSEFKKSDEELLKSLKYVCKGLTRIIKGNRKFTLDEDGWFTENFSIFIIFILQENERLGNKKKIRPNTKDISEISAVLIDKKDNILKTVNLPSKLCNLFETLLQNEISVQLVKPKLPEVGSWKDISTSLISDENDIEIEELGFNITDFATGEKIIIKSNKGNVKDHLASILNQKSKVLIDPDKFDISYIDYMKVRYLY